MTTEREVRREPTAFDAVLGVTTLVVGLGDAVLLSMLVGNAWAYHWDGAIHAVISIAFLMAVLLLGMVATTGVVLRCMGASRGLAARWSPVTGIGIRIGVIAASFATAAVGFGSTAFVTLHYLPIPTFLLLTLALVNLRPRRGSA